MTNPSKRNENKFLIIDILKIVGIILVLIQHEAGTAPLHLFNQVHFNVDILNVWVLTTGSLGAQLFLVASGLGLALSHPQLASWSDLKSFYRKRLLRIYPAYWIGGIIFALLMRPEWFNGSHNPISLFKLASGLTMFGSQNLPATINQLNSSLWFIAIIIQLYLVFPLLLYVTTKHPHISLTGFFAISFFGRWLLRSAYSDFLLVSFLLPLAFFFAFGLGIYLVKVGKYPKIRSTRLTNNLGNLTFFIYLINIPLLSLFGDQQLIFVLSLIIMSVLLMKIDGVVKNGIVHLLDYKKSRDHIVSDKRRIKLDQRIGRLYLGFFGGLIGVCIAGLLTMAITYFSQDICYLTFILCGTFGGLAFGALTTGDRKLRGIFGCIFGLIAILCGLAMTYSTPIVTDYVDYYAVDGLTPIYKWHEFTFSQFVGNQLLNVQGAFYVILGLLTATYLGSSQLTFKIHLGRLIRLRDNEKNLQKIN